MESTITISGKLLGKQQFLFSDWDLTLSFDLLTENLGISLKNLLIQIIRAEVEGFRTRQQQRQLISVLSQEAINQAALEGKIEMGGEKYQQEISQQEAIDRALQAFEDGFYYIFIDDQQIEGLEETVLLKENSKILFLRLVPLVGG